MAESEHVAPKTKTAKKPRAKKVTVMAPFAYPIDPKTHIVCGVDEAGRGPLMGDVVAACVVLDHDHMIEGLNDSKKLSEKKRNALFPTFLAMRRAYDEMCQNFQLPQVNLALIDGNLVPKTLPCYGQAVVKGDSKVPEIAAASILAKVTRDADLYELDQQYPEYHFAKHKGYPTAEHLALIRELPLLPCYRVSYGPVKAIIAERSGQSVVKRPPDPTPFLLIDPPLD